MKPAGDCHCLAGIYRLTLHCSGSSRNVTSSFGGRGEEYRSHGHAGRNGVRNCDIIHDYR